MFSDRVLKHLMDTCMDTIAYLPSPQDATQILNVIADYPRFTMDTARQTVATQVTSYNIYDRNNNTADSLPTIWNSDNVVKVLCGSNPARTSSAASAKDTELIVIY